MPWVKKSIFQFVKSQKGHFPTFGSPVHHKNIIFRSSPFEVLVPPWAPTKWQMTGVKSATWWRALDRVGSHSNPSTQCYRQEFQTTSRRFSSRINFHQLHECFRREFQTTSRRYCCFTIISCWSHQPKWHQTHW